MTMWKLKNDAIIRNYDVTVSISIIDRYRLSNIDQYPILVSIDLSPTLIYINIYIQSKYDLHVQIMFVGIEFKLKDDKIFLIKLSCKDWSQSRA